ncbi:MAG: cyclic peptide export ABC transporter [Caldilineaceae bacterium]
MKLFRLLRYIPTATLWATIGASFLAGATNITVVALISRRLTAGDRLTLVFVAQFALAVAIAVTLDFSVKWLLLHMTAGTGYRLRTDLCQRILQTPLAQLEAIGAPRLLAALTDDVRTLVQALNQTPTVAMGAAILLACFGYLTWLSPPTLLLAALLTLPALVGQLWMRSKARLRWLASLTARDQLYRQYRMLTEGAKELKMHRNRRFDFLEILLSPTALRYETLLKEAYVLHFAAASWTQAIYFLFILAVFVLAAVWQLSGEVLTSFALVALYARTSLNGLFGALPFFSEASVAAEKLEKMGVRLTQDARATKRATEHPEPPVHLCLDRLQHTYWIEGEENAFHLGPISLEMRSSELVFLIGGNGSGKTTLAKLLLGLYTPDSGQITWNGQPVTEQIIDDYRQLFSAVFADFFLFDQLLGLESVANDSKAHVYLENLQLSHKVQMSNGNFSTLDLSTGQRQRLALLTAYLEDRPVYLFDEWAAGQDPEFKELFYRQLLPELRNRGKLVIVISHDDRYYDAADRIVKLDAGQVEYDRKEERFHAAVQYSNIQPSQ